jgi:hypothetical protein
MGARVRNPMRQLDMAMADPNAGVAVIVHAAHPEPASGIRLWHRPVLDAVGNRPALSVAMMLFHGWKTRTRKLPAERVMAELVQAKTFTVFAAVTAQ